MSFNIKKSLRALCICFLTVIMLVGCSGKKNGGLVQFDEDSVYSTVKMNITGYGSVSFRIYTKTEPDVASTFLELCESGFYNGKPFFYIVDDYLLMAGLKNEDEGEGEEKKESVASKRYKADAVLSPEMHPYRGALCTSVNDENVSDLSSFYIIGMTPRKLLDIEELIESKEYTLQDYIKFGYKTEMSYEMLETYREYGGAPWLDGHTAVFGQAYEGLEVLDEIMEAHLADPDIEILIKNIEID